MTYRDSYICDKATTIATEDKCIFYTSAVDPDTVAHACNSSQEAEAWGSQGAQDHFGLLSELKVSLVYTARPCINNNGKGK